MYAVAGRLDPDSYLALARATYAEMALAGVTCVGEFHYLHHPPGGGRYDDPNAMAEALIQAAADAGVRLTLLDACYLAGGLEGTGHLPLDDVQRRFSDGDADAWAARVAGLPDAPGPADRRGGALGARGARRAAGHRSPGRRRRGPLHVHLSEQPAENEACAGLLRQHARPGCSPTAGVLGPRHHRGARHPPHRRRHHRPRRAAARRSAPAPAPRPTWPTASARSAGSRDAGSPLCLGSDQHAVDRPARRGPRCSRRTSGWSPASAAASAGRAGRRR